MRQNTSTSGFRFPARGLGFCTAALALIAVTITAATGFLMARWLRAPEDDGAPPEPLSARAPVANFRDWPADKKPDVVLLLSAQMHGYLQPCGCSKPQFGGLARRWNFLHSLTSDLGWPVVPLDLGDLLDPTGHRSPQTLLKYRKTMEALKLMNYAAVGVGQSEAEMPLLTTIAEYPLNNDKPPVLSANLMEKENNFAGAVKAWALAAKQGGPRVGVACIVGPTVGAAVPQQNPAARFAATMQVLPDVLKQLEGQKPDLLVLLYQGTLNEARACAAKFPQFNVILCLSAEAEPSDKAERVKGAENTLVVSVGHKGRYVGVVGAYRTGKPRPAFDLHYQLVALGEEYETPKGKEADNPIMALMDAYTKEVKDQDYLSRYTQRKHPLQVQYPTAEYVGSDKCKKCHQEAYKVWEKTPHAHAFQELVNAARPANRNFDGECVSCHVTGFGYETGYKDEKRTPKLKDVGCESCHGPGSLHVAGNKKEQLMTLMNPFRARPNETQAEAKKRQNLIDRSCQECHDQDNDVHWDFDKKWPKIIHHEPGLREDRGQ